MNAKQRMLVVFSMLCLTLLMLGFQNCSSGVGLNNLGSQDEGSILDPPTIFASKNATCAQPSTAFTRSEAIYLCIQNAGNAPTFCLAAASSSTCALTEVVSAASGWGGMSGNWVKNFSGAFPANTYTAYVTHTEDPSSFGQEDFTVSP